MFNYAQSFAALFAVISSLGLDAIITRELLKNEINENKILGTAFFLKLIGSFISISLLTISLLLFISNDYFTNLLIYILITITILQSFNVIDFYFQSKLLNKYSVIARSYVFILTSILKIILLLSSASLVYFALVTIIEYVFLIFGFIYFYSKYKDNDNKIVEQSIFSWKFDFNIAKKLLKDSWPLILSLVAITIYVRIDQIMIKEFLGTVEVGYYASAVKISELWYFIPSAIVVSLFPAIMNSKNNNELYKKRLQNLYTLMTWMAIIVAIPMTFLSDFIILLLYGESYSKAADVLMIHIWTGVFVFLGIAFGQYLIAENYTKKALYRTLLGACSNILFNYILIPKYGINGAALGTLMSQVVANYLYDFFDKDLKEQLKMKTKSFFPIYLFMKEKKNG